MLETKNTHQNVLYVVVKNQDLWQKKKQKDS